MAWMRNFLWSLLLVMVVAPQAVWSRTLSQEVRFSGAFLFTNRLPGGAYVGTETEGHYPHAGLGFNVTYAQRNTWFRVPAEGYVGFGSLDLKTLGQRLKWSALGESFTRAGKALVLYIGTGEGFVLSIPWTHRHLSLILDFGVMLRSRRPNRINAFFALSQKTLLEYKYRRFVCGLYQRYVLNPGLGRERGMKRMLGLSGLFLGLRFP